MGNVKNQHVVPRESDWATEAEGAQKASRLFDNKQDAVDYASKVAKKHRGCVIVHNGKGKFQNFKCKDEINLKPKFSFMEPEKREIYPVDPILSNMSKNDEVYLDDEHTRIALMI